MVADGTGGERGGNRRAVIMQDRHQPDRIDAVLVDDHRAKLRVAILLDDVDEVVVGDEARHAGMEREGTDPEPVEFMPARLQQPDCLIHRGRGRAEIYYAV